MQQNNAGKDQLEGFLLGAKIRKVEHGNNNALIITFDANRGRIIIQGQFNLHMETGSSSSDIVDVVAKEVAT